MRGLLLVAGLCALVVAGCGGGDTSTPTTPTETSAAPDPTTREPAPPISGETLDGETVSLTDYRGKPVFVNVWSSW